MKNYKSYKTLNKSIKFTNLQFILINTYEINYFL